MDKFITKSARDLSTNVKPSLNNTAQTAQSQQNDAVNARTDDRILLPDANTTVNQSVVTSGITNSNESTNSKIDDLGLKDDGPKQPKLQIYPKTKIGNQYRSFNPEYYVNYPCIEYSIKKDSVFCFPCRHFNRSGNSEIAFIDTGFNNWKKFHDKIHTHMSSNSHVLAAAAWASYELTKESGSIAVHIDHTKKKLIAENRDYLSKIIDIIKFLSKQGLAFRGHSEEDRSQHKGNFLELCSLFAKFDKTFETKLTENFNLLSHDIQNEFIDIMSTNILKNIVERISATGFYTLLADEAKSHHSEQLAICIRYANELEVKESFLGFYDCSVSRKADALYELIMSALERTSLSNFNIVAQSYDRASVMSGEVNGLQQKIMKSYPFAIYIHCMSHRLNLTIVNASKCSLYASRFFSLLESLYVFLNNPFHHSSLKMIQSKIGIENREVVALSDTRWACRYQSVKSVSEALQSLEQLLSDISKSDSKHAFTALGLLKSIKSLEFRLCLKFFLNILEIIHVVHKTLQSENCTLDFASNQITGAIRLLKSFRADDEWLTFWYSICNDLGIVTPKRQRKANTDPNFHYEIPDSLYVNDQSIQSPEEHYKHSLYFAVLDNIIGELERRFSDENLKLSKAVASVFSCNILNVQPLLDKYSNILHIDPHLVITEMKIFKESFDKQQVISSDEIIKRLSKQQYPNYYKLYQLALTLPVGSVKCERSISVLRRVHNFNRSTMSQSRLCALSILTIESELMENLNNKSLIDQFAATRRHRVLLS